MEQRIITFTADQQGLTKTGGVTQYASDTISYVKAIFTLGENWTGFDEVRAVFKTPYTCKPAVLDSLGECIVPWEVLMYKGIVRVNLVGSIYTEEEVVDRLTTHSVEALVVDEDVPVCGDASAPLTPSEYEQFVAKVATDANRAEAGATSAETSAGEASASATASANSAIDAGISATGAEMAKDEAEDAKDDAIDAKEDAESAKADAESARDQILGMRVTANTLAEGSDATASYSNGLLTLGIPRGNTGEVTQAELDEAVTDLKSALKSCGVQSKVIRNAYPNASGVITAGAWDTYCYRVASGQKINSIELGSASQQLLFAYYADEPFIGSVSYNNSRVGMGSGIVTAKNINVPRATINWIAIRCATSDKPITEFENIGDVNSAIVFRDAVGVTDANSIRDTAVRYVSSNGISNLPANGAWYLMSMRQSSNDHLQLAFKAQGTESYIRAMVAGTWGTWERIGKEAVDDLFVTSTIALFPTVGCCGDSFTAGYLYNKPESAWYDPSYVPNGEYPAIGYPAVMGRLYGVDVTAYAKGGLTSTAYRTDAKGLPALLADTPKDLYIIALGLNDKTQNVPIGVEADIDTEPATATYLGNMGAIIRAIKSHAPLSKIVLCKSLWVINAGAVAYNSYYQYISEGVEMLSDHLGIPYIETLNDPYFCSRAYVDGLKGLHPTAPLYAGMGKRIGELVGKCVIENPTYFYNFYVPNE